MEEKKYDLIAFTDKGLSLDVRVDPDEDTVWLTKDQMAMLFDRDRSVTHATSKASIRKAN